VGAGPAAVVHLLLISGKPGSVLTTAGLNECDPKVVEFRSA
jgi:hypothetical protein